MKLNLPPKDGTNGELCAPGKYRAKVSRVDVRFTTKGTPMCNVTWTTDDSHNPSVVDSWPIDHPRMLWKSGQYQKACGLKSEGEIDVLPERWVGLEADIEVAHREYQGKPQANVKLVGNFVAPAIPTDNGTPSAPVGDEEDIPFN